MGKVLAVVGATGGQGKELVKDALKSGWTVRALTRNADSASAKELKDLGAELVVGDMHKREDLEKAFSGADSVFLNTLSNYEDKTAEDELRLGKLAVDIAKQQNVSHFIYSSLENTEKLSSGKNKVPQFTAKAKVEDYLFASGLHGSTVQISGYYENFLRHFYPKLNATDGVYEITYPIGSGSKFAIGSVADLGHVAAYVLDHKDQFLEKKVAVVGDYLSPDEIAATFSEVWGKPVRSKYVPAEVYAKLPFAHSDAFADMFKWVDVFGYFGEKTNGRDIWEAKKLLPQMPTFKQWLQTTLPHPR